LKKNLVLAGLLAAATTSLYAIEVEPFLGLDFVKGKVDTTEGGKGTITINGNTETGSFSDNSSVKDNTFGIKAGAILDKNHRVYINYFKLKDTVYDNDVSYTLPSINYDYLILNDKLNGFVPYIGAHIGYGKTDFGDFIGSDFEDKSSLDYGINLGVIKDINKNVSLELGYRYTIVDEKTTQSGTFTDADGDSISGTVYQENDSVSTFTFGVSYKF